MNLILGGLRTFAFFLCLQVGARAAELPYSVRPDRGTGVYSPGETVAWDVDTKADRAGLTNLFYRVRKDAQVDVTTGHIDLSAGPAKITATREEAGALLLEIFATDNLNQLPVAMGGAVFSPEKLGPAVPAPADFDAFWQGKLKQLAEIPPNAVTEPVDVAGLKNSEGTELFKVTLDNVDGAKVHGLLALPVATGSYPALLILNAAGVGPLDKAAVVGNAKPGWLVMNISAHDLPVDESEAYYKALKEGALKNYYAIGSEDREKSYFLHMFLGCVRAAEYLASRPDWDGKILVVTGTSQGGLQSFATAGLCPKVTHLMVNVPAGCDARGPLATPPRAFGWPYWMSTIMSPPRNVKKAEETSGYFDGTYFAERIHCPSLVSVGLIDVASRPAGVIATFNGIKAAQKELIIMPPSDHYGSGGVQAAFFNRFVQCKEALQKGKPLPIADVK